MFRLFKNERAPTELQRSVGKLHMPREQLQATETNDNQLRGNYEELQTNYSDLQSSY